MRPGRGVSRRWLLHRRIAQGLELLHTENTESVAVQLAGQYERAGRPERAVAYYQRAADVAAGRFAHAEEIRLQEKALAIIAAMPPGRERDSRELAALEAMPTPLTARYGYSSPDVQQALERSIALAESLGRTDSRIAGLAALGGAQFVQGRTADSHQTATHALDLADPESELAGQAHAIAGFSAFSLGMPADGLRHLVLAAKLAGGVVWLSFGTRPDVHGKAFAAHAHWLLGHQDEALAACSEAITLARAIQRQPLSQWAKDYWEELHPGGHSAAPGAGMPQAGYTARHQHDNPRAPGDEGDLARHNAAIDSRRSSVGLPADTRC